MYKENIGTYYNSHVQSVFSVVSGSYKNGIGTDFALSLSQPTVSVVLSEINLIGMNICPVWLKADMSAAEKQEARNYFFERASLPGIRVVECVDGTHIEIIAPVQLQYQFLNRKGFYSLNALVVSKMH